MIHNQEYGTATACVSIDRVIVLDSPLPHPTDEYQTANDVIREFLHKHQVVCEWEMWKPKENQRQPQLKVA